MTPAERATIIIASAWSSNRPDGCEPRLLIVQRWIVEALGNISHFQGVPLRVVKNSVFNPSVAVLWRKTP